MIGLPIPLTPWKSESGVISPVASSDNVLIPDGSLTVAKSATFNSLGGSNNFIIKGATGNNDYFFDAQNRDHVFDGQSFTIKTGDSGDSLKLQSQTVSNYFETTYLNNSGDRKFIIGADVGSSPLLDFYDYTTGESLFIIDFGSTFGVESLVPLSVTDTTASTSSLTGALTVPGGVGIGEKLYVNGSIYSETGSLYLEDVLVANVSGSTLQIGPFSSGVVDQIRFRAGNGSDDIIIKDNEYLFNATRNNIDYIIRAWDGGIGGDAYKFDAGNSVHEYRGEVAMLDTTASTSPITGALTVAGGVGVGGDIWTGGGIYGSSGLELFNGVAKVIDIDPSANRVGFRQNAGAFAINDDYADLNFAVRKRGSGSSLIIDAGIDQIKIDSETIFNYGYGLSNLSIRKSGSGTAWSYEASLDEIYNNASYTEITGELFSTNTTASNSTTTGAFVTLGGVGIGGDTYVGGRGHYADGGEFVYGGDNSQNAIVIDASTSTLTSTPAFLVRLPTTGAQKGFQIANDYGNYAWASFEFNTGGTGKPGFALGTGVGASARDTNIYRDSANVLKTDDAFVAGGSITSQGASFTATSSGGTILTLSSNDGARPLTISAPVNGDSKGPFVFNTNNSWKFKVDSNTWLDTDTSGRPTFYSDTTFTDQVNITDTTASTSTTTGSLTVAGGVGIGGALYVGSTANLAAGTTSACPLKFQTGSLLTTPSPGAMEYDGSRFYLTEAGTQRRAISIASDAKVSDTTVVNTTTETDVYSVTIQADATAAGKIYRIPFFGKVSTASAAETLTIRYDINGSTITETASIGSVLSDDPMHGTVTIIIRTVGASGTFAASAHLDIADSSEDSAPTTGSIDTTVSNTIAISFQWGAAKTGNSATLQGALLEDLN